MLACDRSSFQPDESQPPFLVLANPAGRPTTEENESDTNYGPNCPVVVQWLAWLINLKSCRGLPKLGRCGPAVL